MAGGKDTIAALRDAVRISPHNVPLRQHLAESLLADGCAEEAEAEYRAALVHAPRDEDLKIGLARAYFQQNKTSHTAVIIEELLQLPHTSPAVYALHARLLLREGDVERAVRQYKRAVADDASLRDTALEERLGIDEDEDDTSVFVDGRARGYVGGDPPALDIEMERPVISFKDVGGIEQVKDEIRMKIIHPLNHPELYEAYGKKVGGGILMYGPPGCGKTHLARATAGEVKAAFIAVGINEVLEMWIGQSERNLHEIFEHARNNRPCVLFFDEVDALGASRSDMRQGGARQLINQFLAELDGVKSSNEGVLILAATNAPWHLDGAFRRPGRFDRVLFVPPPDEPARRSILEILMRGIPAGQINFAQIARKTAQFSGADLKAIVDVAIEAKLREALQSGAPQPLTTGDLLTAAKSLRPSTKEWFGTARNYALYSNQGGLYDEIIAYLKL